MTATTGDSGSLYINLTNFTNSRDKNRQAVLDLLNLRESLGSLDFDGTAGADLDPTQVLFVKGHAAWVPGQLTREIEKGVWYIAAASADLVLRYAGAPVSKDDNPSDLWADVMMCMGSKFESIATAHSGRGDDRMMP